MKREYKLSRRTRRKIAKLARVGLMMISLMSGYVMGYASCLNTDDVEVVSVVPEEVSIKVENVSEEIASTSTTGVTFNDIKLTAGIATVFESIGDEYPEYAKDLADVAEASIEAKHIELNMEEVEPEVKEVEAPKKEINAQIIRCTGYCDYGQTASGEYVREGIIAGKKEWLGRTCNLYRVNEDNSIGELIGSYEFLDTGYGIKTKTSNGIQGSLKLGKSVDVWHPTEDSIWDWMAEYGDYVYIEFTS